MMNAELLKEIKAYLKPARKRLVCSKKSKDDFYRGHTGKRGGIPAIASQCQQKGTVRVFGRL